MTTTSHNSQENEPEKTTQEVFHDTLIKLGFANHKPSQMTNSDYWLCTTTAMEEYGRLRVSHALRSAVMPDVSDKAIDIIANVEWFSWEKPYKKDIIRACKNGAVKIRTLTTPLIASQQERIRVLEEEKAVYVLALTEIESELTGEPSEENATIALIKAQTALTINKGQ